MEEWKLLNPQDLIKDLIRKGYSLKHAGDGIFIKPMLNTKEDPDIKKVVFKRKNELLKYMDSTYPDQLMEEILIGLSKIEGYPTNVKNMILEIISQKINEKVMEAESCDSPIEFELYHCLKHEVINFNQQHKTYLWVHIQHPVVANGKNYRADLFIEPASGGYPQLIIECDGHDFHEKTKQQVQRDKERDRNLQLAGYRVIRFTGSEIFKSPGDCASEVTKFLETLI